jgi:cell division protein FtsI (penicillin-binding protein 3)
VVDERWASVLTRILVKVTEEGGTGTLAAVPGFQVAGKTGTAQKVDPIAGGYSRDKRVASFVGYVPAEAPRLVILVVVDEPVSSPYGGVVAAPAFRRIAEATLSYLGVFPQTGKPREPVAAGGKAAAPSAPSAPPADDLGPVAGLDVEPAPGPGGQFPAPDFLGLSVREALRLASRQGLEVAVIGSGAVVRQSPAPGTPVRYGEHVALGLQKAGPGLAQSPGAGAGTRP